MIMRPLTLALPVSLLLLAPTVGAQSGSYPVTDDTGPITTVEVTAPPAPYLIGDYQVDAVTGAYSLSNGWHLKVEPGSNGIVAHIDKQRPIRLVAQSPDRFVSRDGNVIMEFNRGNAGSDMMMSYVPRDATGARLSQVIVATAKMAQR
jgi:hypothetical protein